MNAHSSHPHNVKTALWKKCVLAIAILVNVALVCRLFYGTQSIVSYRELVAQHTELTREIERYNVVNAALSQEIRLLQSDEKYLEKMIRQRLNFVRENEILYLFTEEKDAAETGIERKN